MVAEDNAMGVAEVILEDLAGKLQGLAVLDSVLVRIVVVFAVPPYDTKPV